MKRGLGLILLLVLTPALRAVNVCFVKISGDIPSPGVYCTFELDDTTASTVAASGFLSLNTFVTEAVCGDAMTLKVSYWSANAQTSPTVGTYNFTAASTANDVMLLPVSVVANGSSATFRFNTATTVLNSSNDNDVASFLYEKDVHGWVQGMTDLNALCAGLGAGIVFAGGFWVYGAMVRTFRDVDE